MLSNKGFPWAVLFFTVTVVDKRLNSDGFGQKPGGIDHVAF